MISRIGWFNLRSKYNFIPLLGNSLRTQATAGATPATKSEPPKPPPVTTAEVKQPLNMKTQVGDSVTWNIKGNGIAVVKIDCPGEKVNSLNEAVSKDLTAAFNAIEQNPSVRGVVLISGKPNNFIAGADIRMLEKCKSVSEAAKISSDAKVQFDKLENSKKPIVAAIMGPCMGGGLELAMACHYRIAVDSPKTQLALPEVMLGLLPGAGGTQRLPKLVDIQTALQMMLTGKVLRPNKAKKLGLVDHLVQPIGPGLTDPLTGTHRYLEEVAIQTCEQLADGSLKVNKNKPFAQQLINLLLTSRPLIDALLVRKAKETVMKQTHGNYPAPLKILDVVRNGLIDGPQVGYEQETQAFGELSQTKQSAALVGLYWGRTECQKDKYGDAKKCERLGVIGAGLMGAGIANVSIDQGIETVLIDTNQGALDRGLKQITTQMEGQLKKKKFTSAEHTRYLSSLKPVLNDYSHLKNSDVVIEAVFEDLGLKHKIIQKIEENVPEHCVIATNTSALPIKDIASASKRPERIIGMHYFSPVDKMQLLEIITSEKTSKETLAVAAKLGLAQKKLIVVVKDCPGFFVVRCISPMLSEVMRLLQEGLTPTEADKITNQFGFPVGMATLADEVGLDVGDHVASFLSKALGPRVQGGSSQMLQDMVQAGFKGKKSGAGIYDYNPQSTNPLVKFGIGKAPKKVVNEKAVEILKRYSLTPPTGASSVEDQQLRVVCRFVNEAIICLEEGIISAPSDGDVASVFGVGFPPFWGGPFRFVDLYGADKLVKKMEKYASIYPSVQFQPCQLLLDHAKTGKKFYEKRQ
uniref:Trifunctional enzyme subunit alpha, mitochondrial n=1 Tax=Meloidogyne enterolobii TaxID=390850 RepID=A0A6V7U958_MELEN|nr:unnamed protein product [Meloidogyne enterolobii]